MTSLSHTSTLATAVSDVQSPRDGRSATFASEGTKSNHACVWLSLSEGAQNGSEQALVCAAVHECA